MGFRVVWGVVEGFGVGFVLGFWGLSLGLIGFVHVCALEGFGLWVEEHEVIPEREDLTTLQSCGRSIVSGRMSA